MYGDSLVTAPFTKFRDLPYASGSIDEILSRIDTKSVGNAFNVINDKVMVSLLTLYRITKLI